MDGWISFFGLGMDTSLLPALFPLHCPPYVFKFSAVSRCHTVQDKMMDTMDVVRGSKPETPMQSVEQIDYEYLCTKI